MDLSKLKIFQKRVRNAKTANPDAYYQVTRRGVWVPIQTKQTIEDYAQRTERSIPLAIDDLVAQAVPNLEEWPDSLLRKPFIEQNHKDLGVKLVHVSEHAMDIVDAYAEEMEMTKGDALDDIIWCALVRIMSRQKWEESRKRQRDAQNKALLKKQMKRGKGPFQ